MFDNLKYIGHKFTVDVRITVAKIEWNRSVFHQKFSVKRQGGTHIQKGTDGPFN